MLKSYKHYSSYNVKFLYNLVSEKYAPLKIMQMNGTLNFLNPSGNYMYHQV